MKYILCIAMLLIAAPAYAEAPRQAFEALSQCIRTQPASCAGKFTVSSQDLYHRFTGYGLTQCIPADVHFVSQQRAGNGVMVRVKTNQERYARLIFTQESGQWKLDIPASLRLGMGENWQQQVAMTEEIFLALRGQFGGQVNCKSVQQLVQR